jgi:hypothetical protein
MFPTMLSPVAYAHVTLLYPARSGGERIVDIVPGGTELERQFRRAVGQAAHTCNNPYVKCTGNVLCINSE